METFHSIHGVYTLSSNLFLFSKPYYICHPLVHAHAVCFWDRHFVIFISLFLIPYLKLLSVFCPRQMINSRICAQTGLELSMWPRTALNFCYSCLYLPSGALLVWATHPQLPAPTHIDKFCITGSKLEKCKMYKRLLGMATHLEGRSRQISESDTSLDIASSRSARDTMQWILSLKKPYTKEFGILSVYDKSLERRDV